MKKIVFAVLLATFGGSAVGEAASYKGQLEYQANCKKCHENGQQITQTYTMETWKKMMENKGRELADLHLRSEKAKDAWEYFKSDTYEKQAKHLKDFLVEYAKDSGNIPACN